MKVSVIIPCYNHKRFVLKAIKSVLEQSWPDVELIVIDDGSTDGSKEIIEQFHSTRSEFIFIARENRGLVYTLSQGLQLATGDFVCELASDDFFPYDSVEKRVRYLIAHPETVAVFADGWLVDENDKVVSDTIVTGLRRNLFFQNDPIRKLIEGNFPVFSTCLFRREHFIKAGGFDFETFRFYEDLEPPILLSLQGKIDFIPEKVIYRRIHSENVSLTSTHIRIEKFYLYKKLLKNHKLAAYHWLIKKRLEREFFKLLRGVCRQPHAYDGRAIELIENFGKKFLFNGPRFIYYYFLFLLIRSKKN